MSIPCIPNTLVICYGQSTGRAKSTGQRYVGRYILNISSKFLYTYSEIKKRCMTTLFQVPSLTNKNSVFVFSFKKKFIYFSITAIGIIIHKNYKTESKSSNLMLGSRMEFSFVKLQKKCVRKYISRLHTSSSNFKTNTPTLRGKN